MFGIYVFKSWDAISRW